ncbi:MAG: radical SAM protein [Syntrophobacteraceae bacterium]
MPPRKKPSSLYHITWSERFGICCLYFWGCNLKCRICLLKKEVFDCHLPETRLRIYDPGYVGPRPEKFLEFEQVLEILGSLPLERVFLMGGEPLCEPLLPRILEFLRREKTCAVTLLTNGKLSPPAHLLDEVIFSIKAITPSLHKDYTGSGNRRILANFRALAGLPRIRLHTETVFIPDYVGEAEILKIAGFIASVNPGIPLRVDAYLPVPGEPWRAPGVDELEVLREKARAILPNTTCFHGRGGEEPLVYEVQRIF